MDKEAGARSARGAVRLATMDRRLTLKLCARALTGAAIASTLPNWAQGQQTELKPRFDPVNTRALREGADEIAETLLGFLSRPTSNKAAMKEAGHMLRKAGLVHSTLYGAIDKRNQFGHSILINGGRRGFLRIEVHNDRKYIEPLVLKKGIKPTFETPSEQLICRATRICTSSTTKDHDFRDTGAEDPPTGSVPGFSFGPRGPFDPSEIRILVEILRKATGILEKGGTSGPAQNYEWLEKRKARLGVKRAFVGVSKEDGVLWHDWLVMFRNGASALVQVATGNVRPVYALADERINFRKADISFDPVKTNVPDRVVHFPHAMRRN